MSKEKLYIEVKQYYRTCIGCPTLYTFIDIDGDKYEFRLRHGNAYIYNESGKETIIHGQMAGFEGVCDWVDVVFWARMNDVVIIY